MPEDSSDDLTDDLVEAAIRDAVSTDDAEVLADDILEAARAGAGPAEMEKLVQKHVRANFAKVHDELPDELLARLRIASARKYVMESLLLERAENRDPHGRTPRPRHEESENEHDTRGQEVRSKAAQAATRLLEDDAAEWLTAMEELEEELARNLRDADELLEALRGRILPLKWLLAGAPALPPPTPPGARDGMAAFVFNPKPSAGRLLQPPFVPGHSPVLGNVSAEESALPRWARTLARNWRVRDRRQKAKLQKLAERWGRDHDFRKRWGSGYQAAKTGLVYLGLLDAMQSAGEPWSGRVGRGTGSGKPRDRAGKVAEVVPAEQGELGQAVWLGQQALAWAGQTLASYVDDGKPRHVLAEVAWPEDHEGIPRDDLEAEASLPDEALIVEQGFARAEAVATPQQKQILRLAKAGARTLAEIARELDVSAAQVRMQFARLLEKLDDPS